MKTRVLRANRTNIREAVNLLKKGEIVAFPTETVYGLGASAFKKGAVKKIFKAKSRPGDDPLIVHVAGVKDVKKVVKKIPRIGLKLLTRFWPGPLTLVMEKSSRIPREVTADLKTVAVRMPANKIALELCKKVGPIAAPSANSFGKPSPTKAGHVYNDLNGKIPLILDGGSTDIGLESTIVSLVGKIRLLRPGKITLEQLRKYLPRIELFTDVKEEEKPLAPGMKYRHYAPSKPVILVINKDKLKEVIKKEKSKGKKVGLLCREYCVDTDEVILLGKAEKAGKILFDSLRYLDRKVDVIVVEGLEEKGFGMALMNRLRRAASKIIN